MELQKLATITSEDVAAWATVAAVLAALFFPPLHDWWRRRGSTPHLTLMGPKSLLVTQLLEHTLDYPIEFTLYNQTGRDRAEDLEVLLSVFSGPVGLRDASISIGDRARAYVPPGGTRHIVFAKTGRPVRSKGGEIVCAHWATEDERLRRPIVLSESYDFTLQVAGANFDALSFGCKLTSEQVGTQVDEGGLPYTINFNWSIEGSHAM